MTSIRFTSGAAKRLSGTLIIWGAAVGTYTVVELARSFNDPGDTKRDLLPSPAFQVMASTSAADTGVFIQYAHIPDTVMEDRSYSVMSPKAAEMFQPLVFKPDKGKA